MHWMWDDLDLTLAGWQVYWESRTVLSVDFNVQQGYCNRPPMNLFQLIVILFIIMIIVSVFYAFSCIAWFGFCHLLNISPDSCFIVMAHFFSNIILLTSLCSTHSHFRISHLWYKHQNLYSYVIFDSGTIIQYYSPINSILK